MFSGACRNLRAEGFRTFAMPVDVFDVHEHVLMKLTGAHRLERPTGASHHDVAGAGEQLGVTHNPSLSAARSRSRKPNAPHSQSMAFGTSV